MSALGLEPGTLAPVLGRPFGCQLPSGSNGCVDRPSGALTVGFVIWPYPRVVGRASLSTTTAMGVGMCRSFTNALTQGATKGSPGDSTVSAQGPDGPIGGREAMLI